MINRNSKDVQKKLVIKPFKTQPKLPENYEQSTWLKLKNAVSDVHEKVATAISKEELYRAVEDLCMHKLSAKIYENLRKECEIHITKVVESLVGQTSDHSTFLGIVDNVWRDHIDQMGTIRNIFLYLDRNYALQTYGIKSLWDLGFALFRKSLEKREDILNKIVAALLSSVETERRGGSADRGVLQRLVRMLGSLGVYKHYFEGRFLIESAVFFQAEGMCLIDSTLPSHYLQIVEDRLRAAGDMAASYLDTSTEAPLLQAVQSEMLVPHVTSLIERGLPEMLAEPSPAQAAAAMASLRQMYVLLDRVWAQEPLRIAFSAHIRRVATAIVADVDPGREKHMVEDLLGLQSHMECVLKMAFGNQDSFKAALKAAFEDSVNSRPSKPAELLARFVDRLMRASGPSAGFEEVSQTAPSAESPAETQLDAVMRLFRHIQSKDIFEGFYKKLLARRLLQGKSANYDSEKAMLTKLKTECGANFTAKLEGMFQDVELSRDTAAAYGAAAGAGARRPGEPEFLVQVLTTGFWPAHPSLEGLQLPPLLVQVRDRFGLFYASKYQGRRLVWAHSLERCVVSSWFPRGKKELEVTLLQALVLLCFNGANRLGVSSLQQRLGVTGDELVRTLQSLACGVIGTRVLSKEPKGKDVAPTDVFSANAEFSNKLFRIKINTIQTKETAEELEQTHEEVFRERQHQVDAALVRIMKARKNLSHNSLMAEILSQLKFPARSSDVKQRIESLIEREYLARGSDGSGYVYLA